MNTQCCSTYNKNNNGIEKILVNNNNNELFQVLLDNNNFIKKIY